MKRSVYHILCSWLLLFLFAAGQTAVYAHQHQEEMVSRIRHQTSHQYLSEKCQLCDAMHHNSMAINLHVDDIPVQSSSYNYQDVTYDFVSMSLILAAGRAPPVS